MSPVTGSDLDPVLGEVLRHQVLSVAEDMDITIRRTTRSVIAKETNDFSAAILDVSGAPVMLAMPYGLRVFCHAVPPHARQVSQSFSGWGRDHLQ